MTDTVKVKDTHHSDVDRGQGNPEALTIECPRCHAPIGQPCVWMTNGQVPDPNVCHFARECGSGVATESAKPRIVTAAMRPRIGDLEPGVIILRTARVRNAWLSTMMPCHPEVVIVANQVGSKQQAVCRRCHALYDIGVVAMYDADPQVEFTVTGRKVIVSRPRVPELGE
jgi:hypothetical protein